MFKRTVWLNHSELAAGMVVKTAHGWVRIHTIEAESSMKVHRRSIVTGRWQRHPGAFTVLFPKKDWKVLIKSLPKEPLVIHAADVRPPRDVVNHVSGNVTGNVRQIGHVGTFVDNSTEIEE